MSTTCTERRALRCPVHGNCECQGANDALCPLQAGAAGQVGGDASAFERLLATGLFNERQVRGRRGLAASDGGAFAILLFNSAGELNGVVVGTE